MYELECIVAMAWVYEMFGGGEGEAGASYNGTSSSPGDSEAAALQAGKMHFCLKSRTYIRIVGNGDERVVTGWLFSA